MKCHDEQSLLFLPALIVSILSYPFLPPSTTAALSPSRFSLMPCGNQSHVLHRGQGQDAGRHLSPRPRESSQAQPSAQARTIGMDKVGGGISTVAVAPPAPATPPAARHLQLRHGGRARGSAESSYQYLDHRPRSSADPQSDLDHLLHIAAHPEKP